MAAYLYSFHMPQLGENLISMISVGFVPRRCVTIECFTHQCIWYTVNTLYVWINVIEIFNFAEVLWVL